MGQDSLDQIKDILYNHEVSIDNHQLWQDINRKKSTRFRKLIISSSAIVFLLLTVAGLGYYFGSLSNSDSHAPDLYQKFDNGENVASTAKRDISGNNKSVDAILVEDLPEDKNDVRSTEVEDIFAQAKKEKTFYKNPELSITRNPGTARNTTTALPIDQRTTTTNKLEQPEEGFNRNLSMADNFDANEHSGAAILKNRMPISHLLNVGAFSNFLPQPLRALPQFPISNEIECYDYRGRKNSISIVSYASLDYGMKRLSAHEESSDYLEQRKTSESGLIGYHAGLQLKYLFDNGIYVKGGIEYGQIRERFAHRKTTETTEILPGQIIQIDIQPNGDTTIIYGNAPVTIIEMKNWRVGNTYKTLDFTALAGYQISKGSWVYSGELGASYNSYFGFKGLVLDPAGDPFDAAGYFKDKINWSLLGAVNLGYKMNSKTTVFSGLNFKHILSPINSAANVIDQKYTNIGIHLGVEFKLN